MTWYKYTVVTTDQQMVFRRIDDDTVVSGFADAMPEYLAWVAEGNEPEEWQPESVVE